MIFKFEYSILRKKSQRKAYLYEKIDRKNEKGARLI